MSSDRAENGSELRVACPKATQHATFGGRNATPAATAGATIDLKAAADAVLRRNRARNQTATPSRNERNSSPDKHPLELRSAAPPDGAGRTAGETPVERGRRLLRRLRWTGRRVEFDRGGRVSIVPRLGTADPFGRDVALHVDDIALALADDTEGSP